MQDQRAELDWRDGGVPVSLRFDDPYFSLEDGLAETRHVFIAGNGLPDRFAEGFQIAELGFGTGLNFLVAWAAWQENGAWGSFHFTSFEAFPMSVAEMEKAHAAFPSLASQAETLRSVWTPNGVVAQFGDVHLRVISGDAREALPEWDGCADAWFLDGFSPAKNPELWGPDLMRAVAEHTKPGGTAATYTAAGHVRRALQDAGFEVTRQSGFGRKRHMTTARKP